MKVWNRLSEESNRRPWSLADRIPMKRDVTIAIKVLNSLGKSLFIKRLVSNGIKKPRIELRYAGSIILYHPFFW